ncbi:hypothetical protein [Paraburkholderia sp. BCC1876]|uniref:hypothetical protein n=1 Tax=Paraburkholderia sp. BCC1876 TaxID=2676303 RepID=UPI00159097CD|nr:hypothetical protein [Paraburkholderia sp. BCC1876]
MTIKPNTKRQEGATMSKEELGKKIAKAKLDLNTKLLTGESTTAARAALRELEDELKAIERAQADQKAAQEAAQRSFEEVRSNRIAENAQTLAEARAARLQSLVRPIPDMRSSAHA